MFEQDFEPHKQVFNQDTMGRPITEDLNSATALIYLESGYISVKGAERFQHAITNAVSRGVIVCAYVAKPEYWDTRDDPTLNPKYRADNDTFLAAANYLNRLGVHLNWATTHKKLAVIDYRIAWGGTANILSWTKYKAEEAYRWDSPAVAMAMVARNGLDKCVHCQNKVKPDGVHMLCANLGQKIKQLRIAAGLSQQELADRAGIHRRTVGRIEEGDHSAKCDVVFRIFDVLNSPLLSVPATIKPVVEKLASMHR